MRRLLASVLLLAVALPAGAWGSLGHRLVGELAQRQLKPATAAEVRRLLAGEPDPSLAGVATWADDVRSSSPELFKRTSRWHYVNHASGSCDYAPPRDCPGGNCVIGAVEKQRAVLADRRQSREARRDALKFLVHFVGDMHQPLHASNRDDAGGNKFQVSLRTGIAPEAYVRDKYVGGVMGTNLHSVWDYYLLASAGLGLDAYAARLEPRLPSSTGTGLVIDPAAWAGESCRLIDARQLYPAGHRLDHRYLDAHRVLAEQRVRVAAERLAALLNASLAD